MVKGMFNTEDAENTEKKGRGRGKDNGKERTQLDFGPLTANRISQKATNPQNAMKPRAGISSQASSALTANSTGRTVPARMAARPATPLSPRRNIVPTWTGPT